MMVRGRRIGWRLALAVALLPAAAMAQATKIEGEPPLKLESVPIGKPAATSDPLPDEALLPDPAASTKPSSTPAPAGADDAAVVVETPGAPSAVVVGSPASVWVEGRFVREPDTFVRVEGRWVKPLIGAPRWVPPRYEKRIGMPRWVPGHWEGGVAPTATATVVAPPTVIRPETIAPAAAESVTVLKPAPVVVAPAPAVVPGFWKQGLLGNYRWVPARVVAP